MFEYRSLEDGESILFLQCQKSTGKATLHFRNDNINCQKESLWSRPIITHFLKHWLIRDWIYPQSMCLHYTSKSASLIPTSQHSAWSLISCGGMSGSMTVIKFNNVKNWRDNSDLKLEAGVLKQAPTLRKARHSDKNYNNFAPFMNWNI